jgi:DNA-binding IclR family transcriptional regulator
MSFWFKKRSEYEEMFELIRRHPGIRPAELARLLNIPRSTVLRRLPSMEEAGFLLYEDRTGGLWPFSES